MKKKLLIIFTILLLLCGCNKREVKIDPFYLEDEYYKESKLVEITSEELEKLQDEKKSFAIYIYLPGCSSCAAFKEVLNAYLETNTFTFYSMKVEEMKKTNISEYVKYAPSFVIFKDGEKVAFLDSTSDDDKAAFKDVDSFNTWLTKYVILKEKEEES